MRRIFKTCFIITIVIALLHNIIIVSNADNIFTDVGNGNWAEDAINFCDYNYIIQRTRPYEFEPTNGLTRGLAIKAIFKATVRNPSELAKYPNSKATKFNDVPAGSEFAGCVNWAVEKGIVGGMTETTFVPNGIVTRQDFCRMIHQTFISKGVTLPITTTNVSFTDDNTIGSWAREAVYALAKANVIVGYTDGSFRPRTSILRNTGAVVMMKHFALINYPSSGAKFYVHDEYGKPIPNASIYVYLDRSTNPQRYEDPVTTDSSGTAIFPTTFSTYTANVFAAEHKQGFTVEHPYTNRTNFFYCLEMEEEGGAQYGVPLQGFIAKLDGNIPDDEEDTQKWRNIDEYLSSWQNFAWRYDVNGDREFHQGFDTGAPLGTPVLSSSTGTVYMSTYIQGCGNIVQVQAGVNPTLYYFIYQHLNTRTVSTGDTVTKGQTVGTVGNSGGNYAVHLHYSISRSSAYGTTDRNYIDPIAVLEGHTAYSN